MKAATRLTLVALPWLLPLATRWVRVRERDALAHGVPLDPAQMSDARAAGLLLPECVRLLRVAKIPAFTHPWLAPLDRLMRPIFAQTAGITLGHGILIRSEYWGSRRLIVHELAHVAQYERLGGISPFLRMYLRECLVEGYPHGALEQEAITVTARVCAEH